MRSRQPLALRVTGPPAQVLASVRFPLSAAAMGF